MLAYKTTTSSDAKSLYRGVRLAYNFIGHRYNNKSPRSTNVASNFSVIDAERIIVPVIGVAGEAYLDRRSGAPFRCKTNGTSAYRSALRRYRGTDYKGAESVTKKTVYWANELDTRNKKGAKI